MNTFATEPLTADTRATDPLVLPEGFLGLHIPFELETNPDMAELVPKCIQYTQNFRPAFGDDDSARSYGQAGAVVAGCLFPYLRSLAQPMSDYSAWAYLANDLVIPDDPNQTDLRAITEMVCRWNGVFTTPETCQEDAPASVRALADPALRLRQLAVDPFNYRQFVISQMRWLSSMQWETALRARNAALGVADYLALRINSSGVYATHGYMYLECDADVRLWADPLPSAAVECGLLAAALDNDRYSICKEAHLSQFKYNIFGAIQTDNPEFTRTQVLRAGVAIRDAMMTRYLQLRAMLLASNQPSLQLLAKRIDCVIIGNASLAAGALRYRAPGAEITVIPSPPPKPTQLPLYPLTRWWWDSELCPP